MDLEYPQSGHCFFVLLQLGSPARHDNFYAGDGFPEHLPYFQQAVEATILLHSAEKEAGPGFTFNGLVFPVVEKGERSVGNDRDFAGKIRVQGPELITQCYSMQVDYISPPFQKRSEE